MFDEWSLGSNIESGALTTHQPYSLQNTHYDHYLKYGKRKYGINLKWDTQPQREFHFEGWGGAAQNSPILVGQRLAIRVGASKYLTYCKREYGINIAWSTDPQYEWILTGGTDGDQIESANNSFAIYNRKHKDNLVYCSRTYGINLKWASDCDRFDPPETVARGGLSWRQDLGPGGTQTSNGTVTFHGEWQSGDTTGPGDTTFDKTIPWQAGPGTQYALAHTSFADLKLGRWRFGARTPRWASDCLIDLEAGINEGLNFEQWINGCGRGFSWPAGSAAKRERKNEVVPAKRGTKNKDEDPTGESQGPRRVIRDHGEVRDHRQSSPRSEPPTTPKSDP